MTHFRPRTDPPSSLVLPVPVDPHGLRGPTPGRARGPGWRRSSPGLYVPAGTATTVEQRIVEQAQRLPPGGAVGGWASLRLHGAAYFDGTDERRAPVPVPLVLPPGHSLWPLPDSVPVRPTRPFTVVHRHGVPCVAAVEAVFAVMCRATDDRVATVALDMALAASVVTLDEVERYVWSANGDRNLWRAQFAVGRADPRSLSPRESWLRQVWCWDAGLPTPVCNWTVLDQEGRPVAVPDLLDLRLGLVAEYDGAAHRDASRHREDERRKDAMRATGLEVVTVVGAGPGDEVAVARRLRVAADRLRHDELRPRLWSAYAGPLPGRWSSGR